MSPLDHAYALSTIVNPNRIHPTALISPGAKIHSDVSIGPYAIIGENISIGQGTTIGAHVILEGSTSIGERNQIFAGAIIGGIPQDLKYKGEVTTVQIGDDNIIREYATINRGTKGGGGVTRLSNNNVVMTGAHVAHDCIIGNNVIISHAAGLAGHVVIDDWVTVGAYCCVHQFVRLGRMSMIGMQSRITKDVAPFTLVSGSPAKHYGLNVEGLRRNHIKATTRMSIKQAYKILYEENLILSDALHRIKNEFPENESIEYILRFFQESERGLYR